MSSPASENTNPKKRKVEEVEESKEEATVKLNEEGEPYWDLGNSRRATLRNWKGKAWVDVREFYGQEPDLKPGKKGIFMSLDQFKKLVDVSDTILEVAQKE